MSSPLVSAIVLNFRTPQETVQCVQALIRQQPPAAGVHEPQLRISDWLEILVVDNHSIDDSVGVLRNRLRSIPNVRIIESPKNSGFSAGYNLGIRAARGRYILVNNPTKKLLPDGVARMVAAMEEDSRIGIVGPKLVHEDRSIRDSARSFPSMSDVFIKRTPLEKVFTGRMRRYRQLDRDPDSARATDWLIGGCLLIRRTLLEQIGAFDPRFFLFFEDIDLCRRAGKAGFTVQYLPDAVASDRKRRLSEGNVLTMLLHRTGRAHIASALKYFWKWH